ncbi:MAG TPA: hypothetical protein VKU41_02065 [Polyangiaceae bacterium]|nr:hypothetical protein [Polyangiaceae bacterium]
MRFRRVEHRDGGGRLAPTYEAELRASVQGRARNSEPLAFVSGTSGVDPDAEESGEEFVLTVTSGGNGDAEGKGDKGGGRYLGLDARAQFAHDTEEPD